MGGDEERVQVLTLQRTSASRQLQPGRFDHRRPEAGA